MLTIAVGQEALFRLVFPLPSVDGFNRVRYQEMAADHPNFGAAMRRGLAYDRLLLESRPDGFAEIHDLNLHGFRGPDFAIEPDPARRRILVIGDSVTEGVGVDDARTFPAVWSRLLAEEGTPAEVVNLGVMGANLPYLWLLVRDAVPLLKPADVVLMLYANDLPAPPAAEASFHAGGPEFPSTADRRRWPRLAALIDRIIVEKPIPRRWPHLPGRFFAPVPDPANPWTGRDRPDDLPAGLFEDMAAGRLTPALYFQAKRIAGELAHDFADGGRPTTFLKQIAEVCRRQGARLIVGFTPFCGTVHPRYAAPLIEMGMDPATAESLAGDPRYRRQNRVLAEVCAELDLPLADAAEALAAAEAGGRAQYWRYDTHPNADGYATIAGVVHATWRRVRDDSRK